MASASAIVASIASKTKTKKKHFVAQKVKLFRASDPLLSVVMWGVNHSVSQSVFQHILHVGILERQTFSLSYPLVGFWIVVQLLRDPSYLTAAVIRMHRFQMQILPWPCDLSFSRSICDFVMC